MTEDIQSVMATLAERLFGRRRWEQSPSDRYWCLSAPDAGYADKFSGPWFRYNEDTGWTCELCQADQYLSEYGDKYLLGGAGMLAMFDALQRSSMDSISIVCTGYHPISVELRSPGWGAVGEGVTLPEAFCRAAYAAVLNERARFPVGNREATK